MMSPSLFVAQLGQDLAVPPLCDLYTRPCRLLRHHVIPPPDLFPSIG